MIMINKSANIDAMGFEEFQAARASLAAQGLRDMAEHNLYASLPMSFPGRFEPIAESSEAKAKHRCHVAELFLDRWGMPHSEKRRASVCEGVRAALGGVFALLASDGKRALLPSDVYPEYARLARLAGLEFDEYEARLGVPGSAALERVDAVLVCDPVKPWGGELDSERAEALSSWASERPSERLLIVDSAYSIDGSSVARAWREDGVALVIASLSKGWLLPRRAGCAVAPDAWVPRIRSALGGLPNAESNLRQAYQALSAYPDRPFEVASAVDDLAGFAISSLGCDGIGLRARGYFAPSSLPASAWRERGVIAIPASAFGSREARSFISVLSPVVKK